MVIITRLAAKDARPALRRQPAVAIDNQHRVFGIIGVVLRDPVIPVSRAYRDGVAFGCKLGEVLLLPDLSTSSYVEHFASSSQIHGCSAHLGDDIWQHPLLAH